MDNKPSLDIDHNPGPPSCSKAGGQAATWISSFWSIVLYFNSGWVCSQHARAPILPIPRTFATFFKELLDASPNTVLSICVGFNFLLAIIILPSFLMVAWEMYRELLSFSENPIDTVMLFSAAQAQICAIWGELICNEFLMYFVDNSKSTERHLKFNRVSWSLNWQDAELIYIPDPSWVPRYPAFGESNELCSIRSCFNDKPTGLLHSLLKIQPFRFCLRYCNFCWSFWVSHFVLFIRSIQWRTIFPGAINLYPKLGLAAPPECYTSMIV